MISLATAADNEEIAKGRNNFLSDVTRLRYRIFL